MTQCASRASPAREHRDKRRRASHAPSSRPHLLRSEPLCGASHRSARSHCPQHGCFGGVESLARSPAVHQYLLLDAMILDQAQRTSAEKESSLTSSDPKDVKLLFDSARDACNLDPGEVDSTIGRVARLRGIEANAEQSRADTCGCSVSRLRPGRNAGAWVHTRFP